MAASITRSVLLRTSARCIFQTLPVLQQRKVQKCGYKRYQKPFLREMYRRRLEVGPDKLRRRSEWINWNYDSEIYAFGKRLGEDFNGSTLKQAFVNSSYVEEERQKRADLGIDEDAVPFDLEDNSALVSKGFSLTNEYIAVYLRTVYPMMFEECILAIRDHLMSEEVISHIAQHLGCEDLILSQEYPVSKKTLSDTFKAVVGALAKDQGQDRAEKFVQDFVLPQLEGKDINDLWPVVNPMGILTAVLSMTGHSPPESRLLWQASPNTIMSLYWVGIYSDKKLIAMSPGETVTLAEEMAAREGLKHMMRTGDERPPLPLGRQADGIEVDRSRVNSSATSLLESYFNQQNESQSHSTSSS